MKWMSTPTVDLLLEQVIDLPFDAQTELLQALLAMRSEQLGWSDLDEMPL